MNATLTTFEVAQQRVQEALANEDAVKRQIREGFTDRVVAFIDMVDSTKFKMDHKDEPEKWLYRVHVFSELVTAFIKDSNGKVVKYIGDEVMAVFDRTGPSKITDAMSLINRVEIIEQALTEATGTPTQVKIAVDFGKVMLLEFDGHAEFDPQGTPVDRCARIAKHARPGVVVSSHEFVSACPGTIKPSWMEVGKFHPKGLDETTVYQLGAKTIAVYDSVEIPVDELASLRSQNANLLSENADLKEKNLGLQEDIKTLGEKPKAEHIFREEGTNSPEKRQAWEKIEADCQSLNDMIGKLGVNQSQYARLLFLHFGTTGLGLVADAFAGKEVDEALITRGLVTQDRDSENLYYLAPEARKNRPIIELVERIDNQLKDYEDQYGHDDEHDFDYTVTDDDFWENILAYSVA